MRGTFDDYVANYGQSRGMDFYHDVHDWLGGWPYESILPRGDGSPDATTWYEPDPLLPDPRAEDTRPARVRLRRICLPSGIEPAMCGIAGFIDPQTQDFEAICRAMGHALAHRGPDHCGYYVERAVGLGLAHRRLSIVDLSPAGHQPMTSAGGRYVIIFDRRDLQSPGNSTGAGGGAAKRHRGADTRTPKRSWRRWSRGDCRAHCSAR